MSHLVFKFRSVSLRHDVCEHIKGEFGRGECIFLHLHYIAIVFNVIFLFSLVPPSIATAICTGRISPSTLTPYTSITPDIIRQLDDMVAGRKLNQQAVKNHISTGGTSTIAALFANTPAKPPIEVH